MSRCSRTRILACACLVLVSALATEGFAADGNYPSEWSSLDSNGLVQLAENSRAQGDSAQADRKLLGDYVAGRYLVDRNTARSVPLAQWRRLGRAFKKDLSADARALWASRLISAFDDTAETREALSVQEMVDLRNALWWVGHRNAVSHTPQLIQKVTNTTEWHSLSQLDLVGLAHPLARAGDSGRVARRKLVEHVTSTYLANAEITRSMSLQQWRTLARRLNVGLSPETRALWIGKLRAAFAADRQNLASLKGADFRRLDVILQLLGDKEADSLRVQWVTAHSSDWASMSAGDLAEAANYLSRTGPTAKPTRQLLVVHVASTYLTDAASTRSVALHYWAYFTERLQKDLTAVNRSLWAVKLRQAYIDDANNLNRLPPLDVLYLSRSMVALGDLPRAQDLAIRACTLACQGTGSLARLDPELLRRVALRLGRTLLCGKGQDFPGYAAAIAELASKDQLDTKWMWSREFEILGSPLGTPESQQTVQAVLIDDQGTPRVPIAHILSWAYHQSGTSKAWITFLDGKIAAEQNADTKARWYLARGFAEALSNPNKYFQPQEATAWFKSAYEFAASTPAKFECLRHLATAHAEAASYGEGLAFLAAAAGQFSDAEDKKSVEAIAEIVRLHKYDVLNDEINTMRARADRLTEKAAEATAQGDAAGSEAYLARAARYRQKATELRNMMN